MKRVLFMFFFAASCYLPALSQQTSFQDSLLDQLAGKWIMTGTIQDQETTHDIDAQWVLAHQYLQIHEISREKDSAGAPAYEAIVYLGWDQPPQQYACLWLDVTGGGGLSGQAIGHGRRDQDRIAFLFRGGDSSVFHTTFVRDRMNDTWQWLMDSEDNRILHPFARLTLRRAE